ncbi:hypothetical protein Q7P37_002275 [Cladosporium fusiforme]
MVGTDFDRLFEIDNKHRILICTKCQYAIVPSHLATHLKEYHSRLTLEQRRAYVAKVDSCSALAHYHKDVVYPTPNDPPVSILPLYFDGLRCDWVDDRNLACAYVCRNLRLMRRHCKEKHGWVNQQKRGGDVRTKQLHTKNKMWTQDRACQRFFKVNSWQKYFEVARQNEGAIVERQTSRKHEFFRAQEDDVQQAQRDAADDANRVHGFHEHVSAVVPWLRETGIADHICGLKKDEIRTAIAIPAPGDEGDLRTIIDAMQSLLQDAHRLCFDGPDCMLTYQCRVVLSRFQSSQVDLTGKTRPFDPYKGPKSLATYFGVAHRFVSYFSRVVAPDDYHFSPAAGDDGETQRPEDTIEATDEQLAVWQDILKFAMHRRTADQTSDDRDDTEDDNSEMKERLLELWMLLVCHTTGARRYESPLLSFCAMLSIKPSTRSWMEPGNFNSSLSAIIWIVQLLVFYDSASKEQRGLGQTLKLVKTHCDRYLQQTGRASGHEASWDEREEVLTYEDTELRMDQIPSLLASEYQGCSQLLYDDLMLGLQSLRPMNAQSLVDGVNVETVGWNFAQHRDNATTLGGTESALTKAIERSDQLSRIFLTEDNRSPSGWAWRESAIAGYEATVQEFLKRLSVLIHISGGQPVRESEFFSMTYRNTQRRRSIIIRFDRVMVHVQYHKGQQQTGNYKENVRFLARPIERLVLDYIVYIMPLRERFLRQKSRTASVSVPLGEGGERACVPRLHVANWRQISVAIVKTKFASHIEYFDPDEGDEDAEETAPIIRIMTDQRNHKTRTVNRAPPSYGRTLGRRNDSKAEETGENRAGVSPSQTGRQGNIPPSQALVSRNSPRRREEAVRQQGSSLEIRRAGSKLSTIMSWTEQVVAILPTGAGKSLLFMLPCSLPDAGITILIVPLVALHGDMLRRVREMKIDHLEWQPGESREASLILVSAEAVSSKEFMKYARRLIAEQKLDRIVIDECHLTVTAAGVPPQHCPTHSHSEPSNAIRIPHGNPSAIHASRIRGEELPWKHTEQAAVEAKDAWAESGLFDHARDKIILYVRTEWDTNREEGDTGQMGSTPDTPYIVATTALAEGFDYAHVRFVMNVDEPESLVIFAQESGRAGRDGKRAYSMVLLPATWIPKTTDHSTESKSTSNHRDDLSLRKQQDKRAVHRYLQGDQCYRTSLSDYLDTAQHRRWCMPEDVPCEICKIAHEETIDPAEKVEQREIHTGLQTIQQERLRAQTELAQYRLDLASVKGTCLLCRAVGQRWGARVLSVPATIRGV